MASGPAYNTELRDRLMRLVEHRRGHVADLRGKADELLNLAIEALDRASEIRREVDSSEVSLRIAARMEQLAKECETLELETRNEADLREDEGSRWAQEGTYLTRQIELLQHSAELLRAAERDGVDPASVAGVRQNQAKVDVIEEELRRVRDS